MSAPLFAHAAGDAGKQVVLLHGFGGSHRIWDTIGQALHGRARTIAYDLPGHGGSLAVPAAGARAMARAMLADLDARGIGHAILVGHSMGGAIATLMAMEQPHRADALVLLAPGGFGPEIDGGLIARYAAAVTPEAVRAAMQAMCAPAASIDAGTVAAVASARALPGQTDALTSLGAAIARDGRQGVIPREAIAALPMPVTLAWGTADPVLPFAQTAGLPANVALHAAEGAGHMLVEERPALVAALIGRHLG